ncbi:S-layer homology domain-containing protein [Niallia oryzisoli]|uniref:S-layer homology domain-containing protein n=1 Tax=Niallia oryzisoli TaxID=1737571 RepID=A0ABZ2CRH9_9BACI
MKKLIHLLVLVLVVSTFSPIAGKAAGFSDVTTNYTFYDEVMYLSSNNFISGHTDGTFRPDQVVTRAQAAIMIGKALNLNGEPRNTNFIDVTSTVTGSGYIASAVERGIISGFPDGTYRPNDPVTRGQMAIFLNRAFTLTTGQANSFNDVSANMAAYQAILNVSANGIASGYPDGSYRPDQPVTRGQFSAFLARTLEPSFRIVPAPAPSPAPQPAPAPAPQPPVQTGFANCTELRVVYPDGVSSSHPAYQSKMDRDNDGWACERS